MRFDYRAPGADHQSRSTLFRTSLEMARWADERGCSSIVLSEHHATDDGYLPSPLQMAAAMAAVTEHMTITVAVAILPFYDPVRLAEDLITLDHLSRGRVMTVLGLGYRPVEYELHGVEFADRGRIADEKLEQLLSLLHGARDSTVDARITPAPYSEPIPLIAWGGRTKAAARRAGRFGIGFFAQTNTAGLREAYRASAGAAGHEPGFCFLPSPEVPFAVFVNDDIEAGWGDVGEALLIDASGYQDWNPQNAPGRIASFSASRTVEGLRVEDKGHRVVTPEGARNMIAEHGVLSLHPLCGGLDPEVAWPYLKRAIEAVA